MRRTLQTANQNLHLKYFANKALVPLKPNSRCSSRIRLPRATARVLKNRVALIYTFFSPQTKNEKYAIETKTQFFKTSTRSSIPFLNVSKPELASHIMLESGNFACVFISRVCRISRISVSFLSGRYADEINGDPFCLIWSGNKRPWSEARCRSSALQSEPLKNKA